MSKALHPGTIQKIRLLRQKGWSLPEIKKEINVGYGTIFRYVKNVPILPEYQKFWLEKRNSSKRRKKIAEEEAIKKAKQTILSLSEKEKIIFLTALYWGEGSKHEFGLSNTDPDLVRVLINGLRQTLGISSDRLSLSIRIYEDLDREKCLKFWSGVTGVPVDKFISVNVLKGKKAGKLEFGMCRVRIKKGGNVLKYMVALRNEIKTFF
ncbi:MAG: hypothetical protein ACD_50C00338G0012 [uncultured bacterium]|nr:MAG: hypothetical protein ACD_50C00338G0012 [uncultured bacterium]OGH13463.1 MAG: hypothetical protein A2687_02130 [Candidatus Levybacteria bacterium RIFCSPHIGHO2_01_FULL_38_26]